MNWDALTAISTAISAIILFVTGIAIIFQLREMRRATVATAFSAIMSFLQAEEVREAREVLMSISEQDFSKWTADQIKSAEITCSTYDAVGIMLRKKVISHKMVTAEWRNSIIKCWEKAQPMINSYRKERGEDFWDDFQWLYKEASTRIQEKTRTRVISFSP